MTETKPPVGDAGRAIATAFGGGAMSASSGMRLVFHGDVDRAVTFVERVFTLALLQDRLAFAQLILEQGDDFSSTYPGAVNSAKREIALAEAAALLASPERTAADVDWILRNAVSDLLKLWTAFYAHYAPDSMRTNYWERAVAPLARHILTAGGQLPSDS